VCNVLKLGKFILTALLFWQIWPVTISECRASSGSGSGSRSETVSLINEECSRFTLEIRGRELTLSPGSCTINGTVIKVSEPTKLSVKSCSTKDISNEIFSLVNTSEKNPIYTRMPAGCLAGAGTGPVPYTVVPGSLKIARIGGGADRSLYEEGVDYLVDPKWTAIERTKSSSAQEGEKVLLDYTVYRQRIDAIILTTAGEVKIINGQPSQFGPSPPKPPPGSILLANILVPPLDQKLTAASIMPVYSMTHFHNPEFDYLNAEALAKTKKKLAAGGLLKIAFCGDSVTRGCYSSCTQTAFTSVFLEKLKSKYAKATINFVVFGIPGAQSTSIFPRFAQEILPKQPDLVIIEIVNDISLDQETIVGNYKQLFNQAKAVGAEIIVCLPHLPVPSYYRVKGWSAVACKPYFSILRELAAQHNVALANVAGRWEKASNEGLDPLLLLSDHLNHPNDRGHEIYAEELIGCFN